MNALSAEAAQPVPPIVEARGVVKRFPGVVALAGVDLALRPGAIHALVGENGAGKSTLIKILSGFYGPDEGDVLVGGTALPTSTAAARAMGIATIHQEHHLVPDMSVAENVMLGGWPGRAGLISPSRLRRRAQEALSRVAPHLRLGLPARMLSPAEGQLVEIARALAQDARVLIMDEPTTALGETDVERLFTLVRGLRADGLALVYVSHKLEEVFELADEVTVLRDGRTVASGLASEFDTQRLVREMVGSELESHHRAKTAPGAPVLEVRGLTRRGVLDGIGLTIRQGEIFGLAGLVGSGRTELAMCLFGVDRFHEGEVLLDGRALSLRDPTDAIAAGIALVPEERKLQALVEALTVRENVSLALLDRLASAGVVRRRDEREVVSRFVAGLRIRTPHMNAPVAGLSGGNQQKVVLARWLAREPRVLILDEPTKGIDVGAKAEIHRLIERLTASGVAVLLISSELPELLALSDRVGVMREGRLVSTLDRVSATKEGVMALATAD
jgi:ABC-type sugar transport system ATPase subunit